MHTRFIMAYANVSLKSRYASNRLIVTSCRTIRPQNYMQTKSTVRGINRKIPNTCAANFSRNFYTALFEQGGKSGKFYRSYCQKAENVTTPDTFVEKIRKFWKGPTFKYWLIGVTGFSSWLAYYSLKSYRSTRVNVLLPTALPNHILIDRKNDVSAVLETIRNCQPMGGKIKSVVISGPSGSGKSILSHYVANELMHQMDWNPVGLPKSHTSVFLHGDTLKGFLLSLQAFAARLKIKPLEIKKKLDESGGLASKVDHCKAILDLIKEKLEKHPNWVIVVDNLQQGSSEDVISALNDVLLSNDNSSTWSKGTVILTSDGVDASIFNGVSKFQMKPRFSENDAIQLLKEITNIKDEHFETSKATRVLLNKVSYHPMATVCAGILLKDMLQKKEIKSIDSVIMELIKDITNRTLAVIHESQIHPKMGISESLIVAETIIAMTMKMLLDSKPHLSSSLDLMSACSPRAPLPATFITRYLRHPSLKLPALAVPVSNQSNLQQMFKTQSVDKKDENLDPKGKAWSNKSITEYITKIENWFTETWQAVKEVYNFYYGELPIDKVDNSIQILQDCELLMSSKLEPGEVESYSMHPLIYAVARQHFLSNSVPKLEENFLKEDEMNFNRQAWFKKMSSYEPKTNLIRFRNEQAKTTVGSVDAAYLVNSYNNALINVSSVLAEPDVKAVEGDFRFIKDDDKVKYLQSHLDRIIHSLSEEVRLSKQTVSGKTTVKCLDIHRDFLDSAYPVEVSGIKAKINSRLTSAKIASNIDNDNDKAIAEVQVAYQWLKDNDPGNSIEIASVLSQLAALFNSKEDHENGARYLEEAVELYESQRRKDGEYKRPLEFGKALGALGVIKGTLGDRAKSKELIERGLMLQQTGAPDLADEAQSKHFGGEFASALIDLGHAYVSLGMPLYGRKILDLALMAHKNIHGEKHPEVVRTLTILSIAHLMQGHNEESRRLRKEAGKIQSQINALPLY